MASEESSARRPIGSHKDVIRTFLSEHVLQGKEGVELTDDTDLLDNGILDSLSALQLVAFLRAEFDCSITTMDLVPANFQNINTIAAFLQRTLGGSESSQSSR